MSTTTWCTLQDVHSTINQENSTTTEILPTRNSKLLMYKWYLQRSAVFSRKAWNHCDMDQPNTMNWRTPFTFRTLFIQTKRFNWLMISLLFTVKSTQVGWSVKFTRSNRKLCKCIFSSADVFSLGLNQSVHQVTFYFLLITDEDRNVSLVPSEQHSANVFYFQYLSFMISIWISTLQKVKLSLEDNSSWKLCICNTGVFRQELLTDVKVESQRLGFGLCA